ncbi:hypothetical protein F4778DRAFT_519412 [Xylariomycetidae sp. FL2044]|nr:hypothetical protein F4778DRAFT_519412 [Xylariomycetidae sp. FL2044]
MSKARYDIYIDRMVAPAEVVPGFMQRPPLEYLHARVLFLLKVRLSSMMPCILTLTWLWLLSALSCNAYTITSSCDQNKQEIIRQAMAEMGDMARNAAFELEHHMHEPRVFELKEALAGAADVGKLIGRFRALAELGNSSTHPDVYISCKSYRDNCIASRTDVRNNPQGDAIKLCEVPFYVKEHGSFIKKDGKPTATSLLMSQKRHASHHRPGQPPHAQPSLEDFAMLPSILLHEMTHTVAGGFRAVHGVYWDQRGIRVTAYGFKRSVAYKYSLMAADKDIDLVLDNADTYVLLALGLYMSKDNWALGYARAIAHPPVCCSWAKYTTNRRDHINLVHALGTFY